MDQVAVSRRGFLRASAAGLAAGSLPALLSACAAPPAPVPPTPVPKPPTAPTSAPTLPAVAAPTVAPAPAAPPPTAVSQPARDAAYPRYIPFAGGPKPDYHDPNPIYSDGFDNYPANPFKANQATPGAASTINVLVTAYFPPPTPHEQNATWQTVNKQLNADVRMNIVPG